MNSRETTRPEQRFRCRRASRRLETLAHREDLVCQQAVCFAVDARSGIGVRRVDEAEDLSAVLVDPVPQVLHIVLVLHL